MPPPPLESQAPLAMESSEASLAKDTNWRGWGSLQFIPEAPFAIPMDIFISFWPFPTVLKTPASGSPLYWGTTWHIPLSLVWGWLKGQFPRMSFYSASPAQQAQAEPGLRCVPAEITEASDHRPWNNVNYIYLEWKEDICALMCWKSSLSVSSGGNVSSLVLELAIIQKIMSRPYYFLIFKENERVCVLLTIYWCSVSSVLYLCLAKRTRQGCCSPELMVSRPHKSLKVKVEASSLNHKNNP